jgi:DNA-binding HxlR family transcriptional regulator
MNNRDTLKLYRAFYVLGDNTNLKILFELDRYGEKTFTELKNNLSINPATLSKKLKILTKIGLITPDKSHDKLRVYYTLHNHQKGLKKILESIERLSTDL